MMHIDPIWNALEKETKIEMHISAKQSNHLIYLQFTTEFQYLYLIFELNVPYWEPATIAINYANKLVKDEQKIYMFWKCKW